MKILDARWFNSIGIVRVEDKYEGIQYFIGYADGADEDADKQHIADWGSRFPIDAGDVLFGVKSDDTPNVHEWTEKRHY